MATGIYLMPDGSVMVAYGPRHIPISSAQYKANGYKPALEKLAAESARAKNRRDARTTNWPRTTRGR